ncbi:MAG: GNAT family N-acetyltransferase [Lachnospiraceae bacterium]|nr:GNAT family N-acetyltransferase [Lachnospiraceae bacterium]
MSKEITWKTDCEGVDFERVAGIMKDAGLSSLDGRTQEKVFRRSWSVVFPFDGDRVIGCGRALSDGICQAAIYNIAVDPSYQGFGLGRQIIERLLESVRGCTTILYTHPQTVKFYEELGGWHRQKTGFVNYNGGTDDEHFKWLKDSGFILPDGFRYENDESENYPIPGKERR